MNQEQTKPDQVKSGQAGSNQTASKPRRAAERVEQAVMDQADRVRQGTDAARTRTAERITRVSKHLRSVSDTLRDDDEMAARLAERASRGVESLARYVSNADARSVIRDTESFARREPAWFYGGAFVLGLAAARFIKSTGSMVRDKQADGDEEEAQGVSPPRNGHNRNNGGQRANEASSP